MTAAPVLGKPLASQLLVSVKNNTTMSVLDDGETH